MDEKGYGMEDFESLKAVGLTLIKELSAFRDAIKAYYVEDDEGRQDFLTIQYAPDAIREILLDLEGGAYEGMNPEIPNKWSRGGSKDNDMDKERLQEIISKTVKRVLTEEGM